MLKLHFAASLLLPLSAIAQHAVSDRASVLLFDAPSSSGTGASSSSSEIKTYSAPEANAVVSAFLNIEEYERLPDGLELPEQIVFAATHGQQQEQQERTKPLMIVAERLGAAESVNDYLSESTLEARPHHQLQVGSSPDSHTWLELLSTYTDRLVEKFGFSIGGSSDESHVKRFLLPGTLNGEYAVDASMQDEAYAPYLNSLAELAGLEQSGKTHIRLVGLRRIAHRFGADSDEFAKAKEMMRLSVDSTVASHPGKVAFIVAPGKHAHGPGHKHLRAASSVDIFSTYNKHERAHRHRQMKRQTPSDAVSPLVPSTSQCFASQDACSNSTNSCSGHGSCVQGKRVGIVAKNGDGDGQAECWVCKCQNGEDSEGRMRYYSGQFCQKEDRSSQFFLLAGSTLFLLLVVVSSVGFLSKIGSEPLPSTLAAMGGGHGGHAKRD